MNLQAFFKSIESIEYTLVEQTDLLVIVDITESNWYGGKFIAYSVKWKVDHYATTLEEALQWVTFTNSKSTIASQDIYMSKVVYETTNLPNWLEEKVGLSYADLEDVTQDSIVIKTHVNKDVDDYSYIKVQSVWFKQMPIMIAVQAITEKNGTDTEILITNFEGYELLVNYLYQFKITKIVKQKQYTIPEDISLVWGYFTEDLLEEAK